MKKILKLLMTFSLFFYFGVPLNALSKYALDDNNLERITEEINAKYPTLSYPTIYSFLSEQLSYQSLSTLVPMPSDFTFFAKDKSKKTIQFKWKEVPQQDSYYGSYLNLESGDKEKFFTLAPDLCLYIDKGYQETLYAFVAVHTNLQSIVKIIIVDRDVFFNASCNLGPTRDSDGILVKERLGVSSFPNPFYGQTTLGFELNKEENVLVSIYAVQNPVALRDLTTRLFLSAGRHEIPVDLSRFPAGYYYALIQREEQLQYIPLLHLGK